LDLEEPDADVDRKSEWARVFGVMIGTKLGERYALAWTDVFEDSGRGVSEVVCCCSGDVGISYP
jgi:hypothetical protein